MLKANIVSGKINKDVTGLYAQKDGDIIAFLSTHTDDEYGIVVKAGVYFEEYYPVGSIIGLNIFEDSSFPKSDKWEKIDTNSVKFTW